MRSLVSALAALVLCAPSGALAQESPLRTLSNDTAELRADVGDTYRRLMLLQRRVFGDRDGARVTITQESSVDPFYRLTRLTYALDGETLLTRPGDDITEPLVIHDGIIGPGEHTLSVVLRYVGDGHGVVGYLPGYRFTMRSSHAIIVPTEGRLDVRVRPYTRGPMVPYAERLAIEYEDRALRE